MMKCGLVSPGVKGIMHLDNSELMKMRFIVDSDGSVIEDEKESEDEAENETKFEEFQVWNKGRKKNHVSCASDHGIFLRYLSSTRDHAIISYQSDMMQECKHLSIRVVALRLNTQGELWQLELHNALNRPFKPGLDYPS